jgi:hypothetical protein
LPVLKIEGSGKEYELPEIEDLDEEPEPQTARRNNIND